MPYSLIGQPPININVKIDMEAVSSPEKLIETLNHMQDEINRQNNQLLSLLITSLGTCAYTDGAGV